MKQFATAARRGQSAMADAVDVDFELEVSTGDYVTLTAHPATAGQLALFMHAREDGGLGTITATFDFLAQILDEDSYKILVEELQAGLDVMVAMDIITWLIGEWSARPTPSSNGSSGSPASTGRRSTAKPRSTA
jgi:hypothetical protein